MCAFQAQHRDSFIQERYGQYDLSDPFLALQRDNEGVERQEAQTQPHGRHGRPRAGAVGPNPRAVLKLVMAHCKRMQERMMGQLAAAEMRHRRVKHINVLICLVRFFIAAPASPAARRYGFIVGVGKMGGGNKE